MHQDAPTAAPERALWGELVASVAVDAAGRGVELDVDVGEAFLSRLGDATDVARVFRNLLRTAVRLSSRDSCVRVRAHDEADECVLTVESACAGAQDENAPRLYRSERGVPAEGRFAVQAVRTLVQSMGGSVDARMVDDLGLRLALHLPHARVSRSA